MKKITLLLSLSALLSFSWQANAQYGCDAGVAITDGYTATGITSPGNSGPEDWNDPNPGTINMCTNIAGTALSPNYFDDDVYLFTYTAGSEDEEVSMTIESFNSWNALAIFASCTGTALDDCLNSEASTTAGVRTVTASIASGQTVYIAVGQWGTPNDLDFDVTSFTATPLTNPPNCNATLTTTSNVSLTGDIAWSTATGGATSYDLTVGSTSGGSEILATTDVGNVTSYTLGALMPNTTYYVTIVPKNANGIATGCTEQTFTTVPPPPVNNDCANAIVVNDGDSVTGNTTLASNVEALNSCAAGGGGTAEGCSGGTGITNFGAGIWYVYTAQEGDNITITTDNSPTPFDTELQVFTGDCSNLVCVGGDDDAGDNGNLSTFCWESSATDGGTVDYYIYVDGHNANTGEFQLDISNENTLSIAEFEAEALFKYYPNPVNDNLSLSAQKEINNILVYNLLGQEVLRATPNSVNTELNLSDLQNGAYFVKVSIGNITKTIRVIKN